VANEGKRSSSIDELLAQPRVTHVLRADAVERGRVARRAVPRSTHAALELSDDREEPAAIIARQAVSREPDLVPIRHGRMLVSPFTFFRGAAAIMAADLAAATPASGLRAQLCGDAHLLNFGGFASAERNLVFDLNDFDETIPGPWEWDVKRLAASITVAAREAGALEPERRALVEQTVRGYRQAMLDFGTRREIDVWYARMDEAAILDLMRTRGRAPKATSGVKRMMAKARTKDSMKAFAKLTTVVDGEPRIVGDPPLIVPIRDLVDDAAHPRVGDELHALFRTYRRSLQRDRRHLLEQYRLVDLARKVVGVGSVGTRCYIGLLMGRDNDDPLFLQMKEAQPSVLAPYAGKSKLANEGQRVVEGQRLMQATSDILLGWIRVTGLDNVQRDFYLRQLWDWKISVDPAAFSAATLGGYGEVCGWTLARAHARSGDRIAIASYLGRATTFDTALAAFAEAYADQNERDYESFAAAVRAGKLPVEEGV
jgi:uncharacterized protein (DUF2252 family)